MQRKDLNYLKYLKYKNKYLNLRNQIGGGIDDEVEKIMQEANKFIANDQYQEALEYINTQNDEHKKLAFMRFENEQNDDWYYIRDLIGKDADRRLNMEVDKIMQEANKLIANEQYQEAVDYIITQSQTIGKKNRVFMKFRDNKPAVWEKLMPFIPDEHKLATRETSWLRHVDRLWEK